MSMNYFKYRLIEENESKELFSLQSAILSSDALTETEKTLKLALLLMQTPIQDYETVITLLADFSLTEINLQVLILGAELDAGWPILQPNPFIKQLKRIYSDCSKHEKSIISYLEAINVDNMSSVQYDKMQISKLLLEESIELCDKYVNNYYRLSLLSDKTTAKQLMEKALSNVISIKANNEKNIATYQDLSFDRYLNEYITGTVISAESFSFLQNYCNSL